ESLLSRGVGFKFTLRTVDGGETVVQLRSASLLLLSSALIVGAAGLPATAAAAGPHYVAGAAGVGDPYYPLYGNGGDGRHHHPPQNAFDPGRDRLAGGAPGSARTGDGPGLLYLRLQRAQRGAPLV